MILSLGVWEIKDERGNARRSVHLQRGTQSKERLEK